MIALQQIQYLQSLSSSSSSSSSASSSTSTSSSTSEFTTTLPSSSELAATTAAAVVVATMVTNSVTIHDKQQSSLKAQQLMSTVGKKRQHDNGDVNEDRNDDGDDDDDGDDNGNGVSDEDGGIVQCIDHVVHPIDEIIDNNHNNSSFIIKDDDGIHKYVKDDDVNVDNDDNDGDENDDDNDDDDVSKKGTGTAFYDISTDHVTKSEHVINNGYIHSDYTSDRNDDNVDDDYDGDGNVDDDDDDGGGNDRTSNKFDTVDHYSDTFQVKKEIKRSKPKLPLLKSVALKPNSISLGFHSTSLKKINKTKCISQSSHVDATSSSSSNSSSRGGSSSSNSKLIDSTIDDIFGSKFKVKSKGKKSKVTKK